jgi:hypothetical protein
MGLPRWMDVHRVMLCSHNAAMGRQFRVPHAAAHAGNRGAAHTSAMEPAPPRHVMTAQLARGRRSVITIVVATRGGEPWCK